MGGAPAPGLEPRSSGGPPKPPASACWLGSTQCRVGIQTCKYCCGDGTEYTEQCGWCVGWWDYAPCR